MEEDFLRKGAKMKSTDIQESRRESTVLEITRILNPYTGFVSLLISSQVLEKGSPNGNFWDYRCSSNGKYRSTIYPQTKGRYRFVFSLDSKPGYTKMKVRTNGAAVSKMVRRGKVVRIVGPCGAFVQDLFGRKLWKTREFDNLSESSEFFWLRIEKLP
jgi:hypothetical protein